MDVPKLPREQAIAVLQALVAWKQTEPVLKQISDWLDCSMKLGGASEPAQAPKRRGKRKSKVRNQDLLPVVLYTTLGL